MASDSDDEAEAEDGFDGDDDRAVPVGVKLGSTRTVLQFPEDDSLTTIRTLTCLATYEDAITGEEKALYGEQAAREYPDRLEYPLRSGLPEDDASAEQASRFFSELVRSRGLPEDSAVVYAVPTIDNEAGLANLTDVVEGAPIGGHTIRSYPESLCGAIPAFGDGIDAVNDIFVAVNMGSTNLEACAYRRGEQLAPFVTGAVTGNGVDRAISTAIEEETQGRVNVDPETAREYKEEHADFDDFEPFSDVVQQPGGGSHEFTVERGVVDPVDDYLDSVVDAVADEFLPALANQYMKPYGIALEKPIALTGGMACIPGIVSAFEDRLADRLDRDVAATAADRPDLAAAVGARRIADRLAD